MPESNFEGRSQISTALRSRTMRSRTLQWRLLTIAVCLLAATACAPEVGSERWCSKMKETPKGDWSTNEASDYAKHCLFKR